MKIRNGFVSNSSSSSFIIGIANATKAGHDDVGEVFDPEKAAFSSWRNAFELKVDGVYDVLCKAKEDGTYRLTVGSFDDTEVSCIAAPGDKIVVLHGCGPDSDEWFSIYNDNDEWVDIDYDKIDFDDFDEKDRKKAELIQSLSGQFAYGAGRNG